MKPPRNTYHISRAQWTKMSCRQRYIYNRTYQLFREHCFWERATHIDLHGAAMAAVQATDEYFLGVKKCP